MPHDNELALNEAISIPRDKAGKRDFWSKEVERWRLSGESQSRYSQQRGLPFHQFNYWVGRLGQSNRSSKKPLGQLLPIQVADSHQQEQLKIKRKDGVLIEVPLLKDMRYLKHLLEVLGC